MAKESSEAPPETFEEAFQVAEQAAEDLERGELALDAAIEEWEKGYRALQRCYAILQEKHKKIEVLTKRFQEEEGGASKGEGEQDAWTDASEVPPLKETLERIEREQGSDTQNG